MADRGPSLDLAARLLGRRAMSARELVDALVRRGIGQADAEAAAAEAAARAWLDDDAYAASICHDVLRRGPAAAPLLEQRLRRRGIGADAARAAAEHALAGTDPVESALALARRQLATMGGVDRSAALRRIASRLARRGFDEETVDTVVSRLGLDETE